MLTVVRNSVMRSFSTTALIEITSAPVMPRRVFAASCTAASAAFAKLSGDEPMSVMTLATCAIVPPLIGDRLRPVRRRCHLCEEPLDVTGRAVLRLDEHVHLPEVFALG